MAARSFRIRRLVGRSCRVATVGTLITVLMLALDAASGAIPAERRDVALESGFYVAVIGDLVSACATQVNVGNGACLAVSEYCQQSLFQSFGLGIHCVVSFDHGAFEIRIVDVLLNPVAGAYVFLDGSAKNVGSGNFCSSPVTISIPPNAVRLAVGVSGWKAFDCLRSGRPTSSGTIGEIHVERIP